MTEESSDVLIVGGGPAGSSCARALRREGLKVRILDQKRFPRDKVCAGWVTPSVWSALELKPKRYPHLLQPIRRFRVGLMHGPMYEFDYAECVSYGIRRCEFDAWLLKQADVTVSTPEKVGQVERIGAQWRINGRFTAPVVVGAGGHFCPIARFMGARPGRGERAVHAQEAEFRIPDSWKAELPIDGDRPELYFCPDFRGYGWVFRKGDYLNIGLGRIDEPGLSSAVRRFVDWLIASGRLPAAPNADFRGHAYLLASTSKRDIVADGMLLIGDAAGLAHGLSGEGIRPAVESGLLAAQTLLEANGDYRKARLAGYVSAIERHLGRNRKRMEPPAWLARLVFRLGPMTRRFIVEQGFLGA
ncbi:MAG: NAD(P)/FAD-dependent oxidoreductase [Alphaproteobacteria bacterium]|nr:MAG: NAD(P)/FAD-dependent oxidoreductase [Alphaproteobacteria bacterium]